MSATTRPLPAKKKPAPPEERDWMDSANPNWETGGNSTDKKTTKPERKAGRIVAKVHVIYGPDGIGRETIFLPADAASVERMVEQAAKAACAADGLDWSKQSDPMTSGSGADDQSGYIATARAALAAIGIRAQ